MPEAGAGTVAVVIPLHNKAATIERALASVFAQTLPAAEILVVDDASSDGGGERAAGLARPPLRLLRRTQPGPGGYAARNLAIAQAQSPWIAFLDADDYWLPQHLQQLHAVAAPGSAALLGAFSSRFDLYAGRAVRCTAADGLPVCQPLGFRVLLEAWLRAQDCPVWTGAAMFQRSALLRAGLFPAGRAARGGDKDLWLRLMAQGPLAYTGAATACFDRTADNKVTHTVSTAQVPIICESIAALLAAGPPPTLAGRLRRLANQEVRLYARQAFARAPLPPAMRAALHLPQGWREWLLLALLEQAPLPLARGLRALAVRQRSS
jgi:hypothetical protein